MYSLQLKIKEVQSKCTRWTQKEEKTSTIGGGASGGVTGARILATVQKQCPEVRKRNRRRHCVFSSSPLLAQRGAFRSCRRRLRGQSQRIFQTQVPQCRQELESSCSGMSRSMKRGQ